VDETVVDRRTTVGFASLDFEQMKASGLPAAAPPGETPDKNGGHHEACGKNLDKLHGFH